MIINNQSIVKLLDARMKNFTDEQLKIIFNSVRYYQMNRVALNSKAYDECDTILNQIFPIAKEIKNER
jgi:hypothetical protein